MTDLPSSMKAPPVYKENCSYTEYKRDLEIWLLLKTCTAEEQGVIIYRTLTGKAKASCNDLTTAQIGSKDGYDLIVKRLDKLYLGEQNQRIFYALDKFEKFKRLPSMTMSDFIFEFENLHRIVNSYNCSYPDGVLAYRLLKSANLSNDHEQLCRATVATGKWTYDSVVEQLKKIFSEVPTNNSLELPVKVENTFHATCTNPYMKEYEPYSGCIEQSEYQGCIEQPENDYVNPYEHNYPYNHDEYDIYYAPTFPRYPNKPKLPNRYPNKFIPQRRPNPQFQQYNPKFTSYSRLNESRPATNSEYKSLKDLYNPDLTVTNPKDNRGNFTICRKCRSIYHWITDCPHNNMVSSNKSDGSNCYYTKNEEDIYIALLQSCDPPKSEDQIISLVAETLCHGVIDSGCSKTVAGENWLNDYLATLSEKEANQIKYEDSEATFRFGDTDPVKSKGKALLPVIMGGKKVQLETEIVQSDVPLLLSKSTMKAAKAKQDYENDRISLFGNNQEMICTKSGHYAIPICRARNSEEQKNEISTVLFNYENSELKSHESTARKLHHQFAHPSSKRLIDYIKTAGIDDEPLFKAIENISVQCDTCKRYKRVSPKPVVMFPLATEFNETVALDLKTYENNKTYFLHAIDHATRFSAAAVIKSKKSEIIIMNFFRIWIAIFGTPKKVLSDNGGEFANNEFSEMCENLNINHITTAAESPWSNGLCERHNGIIGEVVQKILEEVNCDLEIALCWAINAKNSLQNVYGFSPHQLVFGKNPQLPSTLSDRLPALEGVTSSKLVGEHLNALHKARQEMIKAEASEKIRRAIRSKTRVHTNTLYLPGDEVFFKREGEKRWRGPGRVIGQDGQKVLVKTPCSLVSVHTCRICLTSDTEKNRLPDDENEESNNDESEGQNDQTNHEPNNHEGIKSDNPYEVTDLNPESNMYPSETNPILPPESPVSNTSNSPNIPNLPIEPPLTQTRDSTPSPSSSTSNLESALAPLNPNSASTELSLQDSSTLPKNHQCVKYRMNDNEDWTNVKVLSKAGKSGGKYQNWLNVQRLDNEKEYSIDWSNISEWIPIHHEVFLSTNTCNKDEFEEARQKELVNWKNMNVYEEVEDQNQPAISVKWVYKEKIIDKSSVKKARLVARGYEEMNSGILTDSPVCNKDSMRVILTLISSMDWEINSFDIKAAFLQGKDLDRDVFLKPPKEANAVGKLWKLRRCVYGLNDASRYWFMRVREELYKVGCKSSKADPTVFYFHCPSLEGLMVSHVDDFIWAGTTKFKSHVIKMIKATFSISAESSSAFRYLGIDLYQDEKGIYATQNKFTMELKEIEINASRKRETNLPLTEKEKTDLRSAIGQLNWLATQTRPDLSYSVSSLGSSLKEACVRHILKANKLINYCKMHQASLFFPKLNISNIKVKCYADASYGKLPDGGSQGGIFVELLSEEKTCPISWQSKRIKRVVDNVMAAEALAMKEALDEGFLVKSLLEELLNQNQRIELEGITDSKALHESVHSTKSANDRRLRIDLTILREYLLNENCKFKWVSTQDQLADILTKEGDSSKLRQHIAA